MKIDEVGDVFCVQISLDLIYENYESDEVLGKELT